MAKLVSTLFISADGVAEIDPQWHFPYFDDNMGRAVAEDYDTADVLLIGRETYDSFAGAWPGREAGGGDDAPFAKQLGDMRKVVVSRRPAEFTWRNSEVLAGELADGVTALKSAPGIKGIVIPRATPTVSGANFEVLVGFEVTPEMAAFNREGKRFRPNVAPTVASQDTTKRQ
jgi:dihydrofolate reductase